MVTASGGPRVLPTDVSDRREHVVVQGLQLPASTRRRGLRGVQRIQPNAWQVVFSQAFTRVEFSPSLINTQRTGPQQCCLKAHKELLISINV